MTNIRKCLCLFLALMLMSGLVTSLAQTPDQSQAPSSFEDDQPDHSEEQYPVSEELPVQPAPYSVEEDPAIQAEPIDDGGDF